MTDEYAYSIPKACGYLGIERDALEKLIAAGKIVDFTINGNRRIAKDELNRYVREEGRDGSGRRTIMENNE
jgi:excisionase family DNA binding protein